MVIGVIQAEYTSPSLHGNISHPVVRVAANYYYKALFSNLTNLARKIGLA